MKISEVLKEDRESLVSYLTLFGFYFPELKTQSVTAIQSYKDRLITWSELDNILYPINKEISAIMINNVWERFSDDPSRNSLYVEISSLFNSNQDFLNQEQQI